MDDFDMLADSVLMYASDESRSSEELAAEYRAKSRSAARTRQVPVPGSSSAFAAAAAGLAIAAAKRGDGLTSEQSRQ